MESVAFRKSGEADKRRSEHCQRSSCESCWQERKASRLNRPVSKLFPLEVTHKNTEGKIDILPDTETENVSTRPPRRTAAVNADLIRQFIDH